MAISNATLLVDLNISVWTGRKLDKGATDKVNTEAGADHKASQVRKDLLAGTSYLKDIQKLAANIRNWHIQQTLPWSDRGSRILPVASFMEFKPKLNAKKEVFKELVEEFCRVYPTLVQESKVFLGALYDPNDYPDIETVRSKFGFRFVASPVPESGDFRLDLPVNELEEEKAAPS